MAIDTYDYYNQCVVNFKKIEDKCVKVELTSAELDYLLRLSEYCSGVSNDESRQLSDKDGIGRRYYTGFMRNTQILIYCKFTHKTSIISSSYTIFI